MAPPVNDFLKKRIFRTRCKEVTIEIAGLGIKENEYRHGGGLWKMWRVHVVGLVRQRFLPFFSRYSCRNVLDIS